MVSYILPPIIGGVIGYLTNDIAIRMLFRPHTAKYILGFHIPFTPGLIPKEKRRIAVAVGNAISENLMNKDVIERTLLSEELQKKLLASIDSFCNNHRTNKETLRMFVSHYLSDDEIDKLVGNAKSEFEKFLSEKLSDSNIGNEIAKIAIHHSIEKVSDSLLGVLGAKKMLEPVAAIAEPLLAKEINDMLRDNSLEIIRNVTNEQSEELINTPMYVFFQGHDAQIEQAKSAILSIYRTIILEHLPRILSTINISKIVEDRINEMDMKDLEPLIFDIMDKELKAIVWFGAGLGTLIGCINIFI